MRESQQSILAKASVFCYPYYIHMENDTNGIKQQISELLHEDVITITLKGSGAVSNAYYIETQNSKYIVKQEREDKEFQPQNDLVIEAAVIKHLSTLDLSIPVPHITFVSEKPKMYGYEYIDGKMLIDVWETLTEDEKIDICRELGNFHAEIGEKFTRQMAEEVGIKINTSLDVHPETITDNSSILANSNVPEEFKSLLTKGRQIFDTIMGKGTFQFLHNDAQHENILIKDKKISGIIDFGESEYGEVTKEFSRYIRDFPNHFQYIVSAYEERSGNKLSYKRLVSYSLLSGFMDMVESYLKGGEERVKAEHSTLIYKQLLDTAK